MAMAGERSCSAWGWGFSLLLLLFTRPLRFITLQRTLHTRRERITGTEGHRLRRGLGFPDTGNGVGTPITGIGKRSGFQGIGFISEPVSFLQGQEVMPLQASVEEFIIIFLGNQ
jgi:hypothetical protein